MHAALRRAASGLALVLFAAHAQAQIPVEDFVRRPKLDRISFSPDGTKFAALEELKGRMNIVVGDFNGGPLRYVTSYEINDIANYRWISNKRLIFSLTDLQGGLATQRYGGFYAVDADGTGGRDLGLPSRYVNFFQRIPGSDDEIVAVTNERVSDSPDLVRLNTRTGASRLLTPMHPGRVSQWAIDRHLVPRAVVTSDKLTLESTFWYRDSADAEWQRVRGFKFEEPHFVPIGFARDGTLYVASNLDGGDKLAIHKFDPKTRLPGERIARHPGADVDTLMFDTETDDVVGVAVDAGKPETVWFEERRARVQAAVDRALPAGAVNSIGLLPESKSFIRSFDGSDPGTYYIYDEARRSLKEVARPRAWIKPEQMGRMEPIRYKARDGLEIPAYLTLPQGNRAKNLPLVVWVHGGPWARDDYEWDPDAQFFASRGYAVLQPNYRGSSGFGLKHLSAGYKQLGQAMQDDVTDGVRKLVADGTVDASRVCIGGASYGGYATMMGLIREPSMFKCGINVVGVVDLKWWIDIGYTNFNRGDARASEAYLTRTVGDPAADAAMMEANSPRLQAAKIKAPVLIIHGGGDQRVPVIHGESMRDALKASGKEVEWLVFPDEGHGFMKESSRVEYYRRMEAFLAKHLGR